MLVPILRRWVGGMTSIIKSYYGRLKKTPNIVIKKREILIGFPFLFIFVVWKK